ncbi:PAN/Apple domain-containing protein [Aerosakkonemataceae cyanobacterium BLCC-F50]|uniref:PAN/Apple domain-containing protein n=1 Tax=Floridaenema flaviceps BLCC-F50 TaxID=3153642 RepID=A0ABV4XKY5_9CYAN
MEQTLLVVGAVLIFIGIVGGNFKMLGAEVTTKISNPYLRGIAILLGLALLLIAMGDRNPFANSFKRVEMTRLEDTDFYGGDLANFPVENADECSKRCEKNTSCVAYTYDKRSDAPGIKGSYCYLKDKISSANANTCCTSGKKLLK